MKKYVNFGCVSLGKSENGSLIQDCLDHGASKEPMNPPGKGFFGFFDAPWSKRSWINNPFSDFPKETHPSSKPFKRFSAMLNQPCPSFTDVLNVPNFVSFVLLSHCVDTRICQQFYPNKAFWNNGMIWEKTAVVCAFEEEIHYGNLHENKT